MSKKRYHSERYRLFVFRAYLHAQKTEKGIEPGSTVK